MVTLNDEIQQTGVILSAKGAELVEARVVIRNVSAVIESITTCQYTLSLARKVREYIDAKRFYPAIKILEQIQQVHLQNVVQYEWGRYLQRKIPMMKQGIKKRVLMDVSSWLLMIRNASGEVGRFSMAQTNATIEKKEELNALRTKDVKEYTDIVITKRRRASIAPNARPSINGEKEDDETSKIGKSSSNSSSNKDSNGKKPSISHNQITPTFTLLSDGSDITEVSVFEVVNLNFAPLYQCSYIHEVLGEKEEFQKYYKESRKLQSNIILQQPAPGSFMQSTTMAVQSTWTLHMDESSWSDNRTNSLNFASSGLSSSKKMPSNSSSSNLASLGKLDSSTNQVTLPVYAKYLNAIAGFFIVEATVLQTSNQLINSADVTALWDAASNKMRAVLQVEVAYCEDIDSLPELKNYLLVFCRTLRKYGYNLNMMHDFVKTSLRDRYVNVTLDRLTLALTKLCDHPNASIALQIKNDKDFQEFVTKTDIASLFRDKTKKNFPFSVLVPEVIRMSQQFTVDLNKFCSNLPDAETIVVHGLDQLMKIFVTALQNRDYASDPTVLNLGMHFINAHWFMACLPLIEEHLTTLGISAKLDPTPFQETSRILEEMLYDLNTKFIDRQFEAFLDNCQPQYSKVQSGPRVHIQTIFNEINDTFPKLSEMPGNAFESMYKREFNMLIDRMMGLLLTDRIRYYDLAYIKCLDQDLLYVEDCAKKAPVAVLDDSFAEIRQIVNLLMQPDQKVFFDPALRSTQYNKINNTKKLAAVLKKFKEPGGFGPFSAVKAKRKAVKAVMAQLM